MVIRCVYNQHPSFTGEQRATDFSSWHLSSIAFVCNQNKARSCINWNLTIGQPKQIADKKNGYFSYVRFGKQGS